ncbi:helix-turn-helix transcriptional regulator [Phenylobacterium sp.]|uniref:helix-turn-helix domain-containing protein n=1 Tax=Phenylobacterium sp. TaxID=1871053 RepID=UPI001204890E|nr:helix-turn-helix transcriptional regulator [Phenylobacterium sp.]THD52142.1 MAG: XRE family transcriptional regulator [Phenylobacterium sp.]
MSEIVNIHIGRRLRQRRKILGLTQTELAANCGLRFQQIQKYECAVRQMSAAMLWRIAHALGVGAQYFYEGLDGEAARATPTYRKRSAPAPANNQGSAEPQALAG